jgi:hypothetical protein
MESDLATVQAALHASEEETALARTEAADVHAQAAGASLTLRASICFHFR